MEDLYDRKVAIKALVGSHNYNLNTANSDEDYKYFVFPTFDDLYTGKMFSTSVQSETLDYDCHDIRQFANLIWKANINFVEVLYSCNIRFVPALAPIFCNRDMFSLMNPFTFYNATYGMHLMKMKELHKGTAKTDALVEKFGYDTKQACHALRCLYVLDRVASGMSMGEALWFEDGSHDRDILMHIKNSEYTEDEFIPFVTGWHSHRANHVKEWFASQETNEGAKDILDAVVRDEIKRELIHQG
jgi:predicted nucleotidyltransferase